MAGAVTLRPALATDLPAMAAVEKSAYPAAVREGAGVLGAHVSLDPEGAWVACAAGVVVGYVLSHPLPLAACPMEIDGQPLADGARPAAETLYLHDIAVLPQFRAAGAGRLLLARVEGWALELGLPTITLTAVCGAWDHWARRGFSELARASTATVSPEGLLSDSAIDRLRSYPCATCGMWPSANCLL